jgi:magnesium-protoporphyrin IX monomethyl ester (oxidative) cyclase
MKSQDKTSLKILLLNPPRVYFKGSKEARIGLPLGIMYLAAVLEQNNYFPKILDCLIHPESTFTIQGDREIHGIPEKRIIKIIEQEKPDLVGITCPFTAQIDSAIRIAGLVKRIDRKITTVIGGSHSSIRGTNLLEKCENIDIAVKGEGENTFLQIAEHLEKNTELSSIQNIVYRDQTGKIKQTASGGYIMDLDALPYPAYHLVDMRLYFDLLDQGMMTRPSNQKRSISLISSRGCPFNCVFCSIHLHMGKKWRAHSAEYIVDHIEYVVTKYDVKHISFEDDNLTLDIERARSIFSGIIEKNIKITWDAPNGIRADRMDEAFIRLMKKSGCIELIIGVESGDQAVLDKIIDKKLDLNSVIKIAAICKKLKIKTQAFFVIGIPGEKGENIKKTLDFALMLKKKYGVIPNMNIATPLFGTRMYDIAKKNNYLVKEPDPRSLSMASQTQGSGLIQTEEFNPAQIKELALDLEKKVARIDLLRKLAQPSAYLRKAKSLLNQMSGWVKKK